MPLSYSQLRSYATCPRQFEYAYVKKLKTPLTPEMCFGVSVHTTLSKWGKLEMEGAISGKRQAARAQTTLFSEDSSSSASRLPLPASRLLGLWHSSFVTEGYPTLAASEFDRLRGEKLMEGFFAWWAKEPRKVVGIEKWFSVELCHGERRRTMAQAKESPFDSAQGDTVSVAGRFDRVEELPDGTLRIIDFKSGSLRSQEAVDQDHQLSIYCIAAKETFGKET